MEKTTHAHVLDFAIQSIIDRSKRTSLQKEVLNLVVEHEYIRITWRNKDEESLFTLIIKANDDPRTKDIAKIMVATVNHNIHSMHQTDFEKINL